MKKRLDAARLTGVVIGVFFSLAWTVILFIGSESRFSFYTIPTILVFVIPLIAGIGIGLRRSITAGILLIFFAFIMEASVLIESMSSIHSMHLYFSPVTIPLALTGLPFLFSRKQADPQREIITLSKLLLAGMLLTGLAVLASLISEYLSRANSFFGVYNATLTAIITSGGLIILVICARVSPRWGGITGLVYAVLMGAYWVYAYAGGQELHGRMIIYPLIPLVMLAGSVLVTIAGFSSSAGEKDPLTTNSGETN